MDGTCAAARPCHQCGAVHAEHGDCVLQVIVVVTHGWHVLCFDHNLKLMWDQSIRVRPSPFSSVKQYLAD